MKRTLSDVSIQWADLPRDDGVKFVELMRISPLTPLRAFIVSNEFVGVETHFIGGRTLPCIGRKNGCTCADGTVSTRWKGYLGVEMPATGRLALVELTKKGLESCPEILAKNGALRGFRITIARTHKNKNSPQRIELESMRMPVRLAPHFCIRTQLLAIWGMLPKREKEAEDEVA